MIMITNSYQSLPANIFHIHRVLQYLIGSLLILSSWHHYDAKISILAVLIVMILYQSLALLLNTKLNLSISGKITVLIVFIDGIITGLLIHFCGHYHHLSIGIGGLFLFVYVRAFSIITFAAIAGVSGAIFITTIFPLPLHYISHSNEIILLNMLGIFFVVFCFERGCHEKILNEKLELQFNVNTTLKLHIHSLSKYLSPRLSQSIIAGNHVQVDAIDKPLTVFFSDIEGFSQLSEQLNPEKLSWLVNSYLSEMSEIVFRFGGTLDKMIGDSIMVFFGDPNTRGRQRDAIACVCMAIAMRESMRRLKTRWENDGIKNPPSIRMGINSGECRVGNFGTESILDYTVLGNTVNLANHLESTADADEILITEDTYKLVKSTVECTEKKLAGYQWLSKTLTLYSVQKVSNQDR